MAVLSLALRLKRAQSRRPASAACSGSIPHLRAQVARLARQLPTGDQAALAEQLKLGKDEGTDEPSAVNPDDLT